MTGHGIDASKTNSTTQTWFGQQNYTAPPEETEKDKLKNGNVWDYARNMQAGAYMG